MSFINSTSVLILYSMKQRFWNNLWRIYYDTLLDRSMSEIQTVCSALQQYSLRWSSDSCSFLSSMMSQRSTAGESHLTWLLWTVAVRPFIKRGSDLTTAKPALNGAKEFQIKSAQFVLVKEKKTPPMKWALVRICLSILETRRSPNRCSPVSRIFESHAGQGTKRSRNKIVRGNPC